MAIITISRGTYSGGKALAECLSKDLGYRLLSREELLTSTANASGVSEQQLESALAYRPGFMEGRGLGKLHYIYCVQASLAKAVQSDNVVYHGQAGHLLLKGIPHHLRLMVVANMEYRIAAARKRSHLTRDKAIQLIKELDEERDKWVQWVYGVDRTDPTTYDLEINLERIPIQNVCATVADTARRDFQTTAESQKIVDDLVLSSEVRARIGSDRGISDHRIEVEAKDGVVAITGIVRSSRDMERVSELVKQIPGVKDVESKLGTRW